MRVEGIHDGGMMETVTMDDNGVGVHCRGFILGVTDLVGRTVHGGQVDVVLVAGGVVVTLDLQMREDVTLASKLRVESVGAVVLALGTTADRIRTVLVRID